MNNSTPWWAVVVWLLTMMVVYVAQLSMQYSNLVGGK